MASDHKINVTLKEGTGFDAPWIVVGGDSVAEVRDRLGEIEASGLLVDVGRVSSGFKGSAAMGGTLGARPVSAPAAVQPQPSQPAPQPQQPQQAPAQGWGQPQAPAPQAAPQAPAQGGPRVVKDNFNNEWEYDVPGAPTTPRGPAIVKRGINAKNGNMWRKWYDPSAGPEWFANRQPKVAAGDRWQGEFID